MNQEAIEGECVYAEIVHPHGTGIEQAQAALQMANFAVTLSMLTLLLLIIAFRMNNTRRK